MPVPRARRKIPRPVVGVLIFLLFLLITQTVYIRLVLFSRLEVDEDGEKQQLEGQKLWRLRAQLDTFRKRLDNYESEDSQRASPSLSLCCKNALTCKEKLKNCKTDADERGADLLHLNVSDMMLEQELSSQAYWLVIAIPTVRRTNKTGRVEIDYLTNTLDALKENLPVSANDPLWGKVKIVVYNNNAGAHKVFERNKERLASEIHFDFDDNKFPTPDKDASKKDEGSGAVPGYRVRQQTRDVVTTMRYIIKNYKFSYFLFMEDDFELCSHGFDAIRYLLDRATLYHGDWIAIRASYGLNGIFLQAQDVDKLANYFEQHQARRPPDHLIVEWFAGETKQAQKDKGDRVNIGFRYNLW
eukprot:CAMPEP_0204842086 /NCGR_PEP_ID=MMETSP1346-20131115/44624_1 /ASSEMBLY_ACC=CAM_ASM_000771 /TAXON_ID=215587 /ORGANISM="Aplanochytrium stocchinoi, Strain GSBS06" /LENGTH=356 /DNA_ID=CAMNT_0051980639 /DNA_START=206 /DNA_END=1273 /DNA_ORIENTATION=+